MRKRRVAKRTKGGVKGSKVVQVCRGLRKFSEFCAETTELATSKPADFGKIKRFAMERRAIALELEKVYVRMRGKRANTSKYGKRKRATILVETADRLLRSVL